MYKYFIITYYTIYIYKIINTLIQQKSDVLITNILTYTNINIELYIYIYIVIIYIILVTDIFYSHHNVLARSLLCNKISQCSNTLAGSV